MLRSNVREALTRSCGCSGTLAVPDQAAVLGEGVMGERRRASNGCDVVVMTGLQSTKEGLMRVGWDAMSSTVCSSATTHLIARRTARMRWEWKLNCLV